MTPKRTVVVAVAVAVGVAASVLSYVFLNNAQQNAYHNAKLVQAYVVVKPVPASLSGAVAIDEGYVQTKKIPQEFRPTSAITKISSIRNEQAVTSYGVGQVLVASMFAGASSVANTLSEGLANGHVAVTASVDQVHAVADFPGVGDKVDLMVDLNGSETLLLQGVEIIAVGQSATAVTPASTQSTPATTVPVNTSGLFTFSVSPTDAEKIALAEQDGLGLYMTLTAPKAPPVTIPPVNQGNITNAL